MRKEKIALYWSGGQFRGVAINGKMLWIADGVLHVYEPNTGHLTTYHDPFGCVFNRYTYSSSTHSLVEKYFNQKLSPLGISNIKIETYYASNTGLTGDIELIADIPSDAKVEPIESVSLYGSMCNRTIVFDNKVKYWIAHDRGKIIIPLKIIDGIPHVLNPKIAEITKFYYTIGRGIHTISKKKVYFPVTIVAYNKQAIYELYRPDYEEPLKNLKVLYIIPRGYIIQREIYVKVQKEFKWITWCKELYS